MHPRCFVLGHDDLRHREPGRVYLQCAVCGRQTPGWTLDLPAPTRACSRLEPSSAPQRIPCLRRRDGRPGVAQSGALGSDLAPLGIRARSKAPAIG